MRECCITTPVCVTSSTSPIPDAVVIEDLGPAEGKSGTWSVLELWMVGRPDLNEAIADALRKKGGDALINVRCYETTRHFLLFSITTVYVSGDAVKFKKAEK